MSSPTAVRSCPLPLACSAIQQEHLSTDTSPKNRPDDPQSSPPSSCTSSSSTCSSPEVSAPTSPSCAYDAASAAGVGVDDGAHVDERLYDLPRLFIFDKDGTLICFHSMWHPWLQDFIKRIEATSGLLFEEALNSTYGYNVEQQKFQVGLMAEGTMDQCKEEAVKTVAVVLGREKAEKIVNACWQDCDTSSSRTLRLACDAIPLLAALKSRGVKIAMCTADTRIGAEGAIDKLGIANYFDMIVAGGDEDSKPKPDPHNALKICRELSVAPEEALMVGDTTADILFGKNAGFKLTLGVLSGVGGREHFQQADFVIDSVEQIFQLFPILRK